MRTRYLGLSAWPGRQPTERAEAVLPGQANELAQRRSTAIRWRTARITGAEETGSPPTSRAHRRSMATAAAIVATTPTATI